MLRIRDYSALVRPTECLVCKRKDQNALGQPLPERLTADQKREEDDASSPHIDRFSLVTPRRIQL